MLRKKQMIAGILIAVLAVVIISIGVHYYYYAWTDRYLSCIGKVASSPRSDPNQAIIPQKLDYFTTNKVSYGFLSKEEFLNPFKNKPEYQVEERMRGYVTVIKRKINNGNYQIKFEYVWRKPFPNVETTVYDGIGVSYYIYEECGVPYHEMEKNLRMMLDEMPLDAQLLNEMREKLSLEFSTYRNLIRLF